MTRNLWHTGVRFAGAAVRAGYLDGTLRRWMREVYCGMLAPAKLPGRGGTVP